MKSQSSGPQKSGNSGDQQKGPRSMPNKITQNPSMSPSSTQSSKAARPQKSGNKG